MTAPTPRSTPPTEPVQKAVGPESVVTLYRCPDCGDQYVRRSARWERLLSEQGSIEWCLGPSTGADPHPQPVACEPVQYAPVGPGPSEDVEERLQKLVARGAITGEGLPVREDDLRDLLLPAQPGDEVRELVGAVNEALPHIYAMADPPKAQQILRAALCEYEGHLPPEYEGNPFCPRCGVEVHPRQFLDVIASFTEPTDEGKEG